MALFPEYDDLTDEQQEVCEDIESELLVAIFAPEEPVVFWWHSSKRMVTPL